MTRKGTGAHWGTRDMTCAMKCVMQGDMQLAPCVARPPGSESGSTQP